MAENISVVTLQLNKHASYNILIVMFAIYLLSVAKQRTLQVKIKISLI